MLFVYVGGGLAALFFLCSAAAVALCGMAAKSDRDTEAAMREYRAQKARAERAVVLERPPRPRRRGDSDGETCAATVARS